MRVRRWPGSFMVMLDPLSALRANCSLLSVCGTGFIRHGPAGNICGVSAVRRTEAAAVAVVDSASASSAGSMEEHAPVAALRLQADRPRVPIWSFLLPFGPQLPVPIRMTCLAKGPAHRQSDHWPFSGAPSPHVPEISTNRYSRFSRKTSQPSAISSGLPAPFDSGSGFGAVRCPSIGISARKVCICGTAALIGRGMVQLVG